MGGMGEKLRIDKYLWAIRLFKTRTQAADACIGGKVRCEGSPVKASRPVALGDIYEVRIVTGRRVVRVTGLADRRGPYSEAIRHYEDLTPPEEHHTRQEAAFFPTGKRRSKIGRPTKKQRRSLDDLLDGPD